MGATNCSRGYARIPGKIFAVAGDGNSLATLDLVEQCGDIGPASDKLTYFMALVL